MIASNVYDTCVVYSSKVPDVACSMMYFHAYILLSLLMHYNYLFSFHMNVDSTFILTRRAQFEELVHSFLVPAE